MSKPNGNGSSSVRFFFFFAQVIHVSGVVWKKRSESSNSKGAFRRNNGKEVSLGIFSGYYRFREDKSQTLCLSLLFMVCLTVNDSLRCFLIFLCQLCQTRWCCVLRALLKQRHGWILAILQEDKWLCRTCCPSE